MNECTRALVMLASVALALVVTIAEVHSVRVLSPSMEPTLAAGDIALVRTVPAQDLRVGMVVVARDLQGSLYLHRIVKVLPPANGVVRVRTKGDANPMVDPWVEHITTPDAYVMFARLPLGSVGQDLPVA